MDLYADGGVILKNPSIYGGTWAFCFVENGEIVLSGSGVLKPAFSPLAGRIIPVTNNVAEMYAIIMGLNSIAPGWSGTIYSDSQITLGRISGKYKHFEGIPISLKVNLIAAKSRHNFSKIKFILVGGHPTIKELTEGKNNSGNPVSKWNVWCDKKCKEEAKNYLKGNNGNG